MIASNKQGEVVLGGSPRLNLLPTAQQPTRGARQGTALLSILLITALIAGAGVAAAWYFSDQKSQELLAIEAENNRLEAEIASLGEVSIISQEAVRVLLAKRQIGIIIDAPKLLHDLVRILPAGVYLYEYQQRFDPLSDQQLVLTIELRFLKDTDLEDLIARFSAFHARLSSRVDLAEVTEVQAADGYGALKISMNIDTAAYSVEVTE